MPKRPVKDDYEQPFVSIIVPTYNEESNIALCLQSLKELNYSRYEIIVSDGGSTDRTVEMAKSFVDKVVIDKIVPPVGLERIGDVI
ncbi:MAG: glycosyltransferase [Asgard group archaeon]|nr:glycosyltransferase [Asgard group archaeon]